MALLIGVIAVYAYNVESFSIRREIKNGMIHPAAYLISNLVIQLPLLLIASIFAISVSGYGIGDFNGDKYFEFLFMYWLLLWTCEAVAQVIPEFLFTRARFDKVIRTITFEFYWELGESVFETYISNDSCTGTHWQTRGYKTKISYFRTKMYVTPTRTFLFYTKNEFLERKKTQKLVQIILS